MQVGRAQPDAVERHVGVATGLAKMAETMRIAGVEGGLVERQIARVGVEPRAVGGDVRDRRDVANLRSGEVAAAGAVAVGAIACVYRRAAGGEGVIDRQRPGGRGEVEEPGLDAADGSQVDGGGRGAVAEGGALVALLGVGVVAVPVQFHTLTVIALHALALVPDRGKIRGAQAFLGGQLRHRKVEQHLRGVEGVDPARAPRRLIEHEAEAPAQHQQALAHQRDRDWIDEVAVDEPEPAAQALDLGHDELV